MDSSLSHLQLSVLLPVSGQWPIPLRQCGLGTCNIFSVQQRAGRLGKPEWRFEEWGWFVTAKRAAMWYVFICGGALLEGMADA